MRSCAGPDIDLNYFCCYFIFLQVIHGRFVAGFYFTMLSNWLVKLAPFQPFALLQTEANNEFLTVIINLFGKRASTKIFSDVCGHSLTCTNRCHAQSVANVGRH